MRRPIVPGLLLLALVAARPAPAPAQASAWEQRRIGEILLLAAGERVEAGLSAYRPLVALRGGEPYRYADVRRSIENLNRAGVFADIEAKVLERSGNLLDVLFVLHRKPRIRTLEFAGDPPLAARTMRAAIYSLRRGELYEESLLPKARAELLALLRARGFFNAQASPRVTLSHDGASCAVQFVVAPGSIARVAQLTVDVDDAELAGPIRRLFARHSHYVPDVFARETESARQLLKKRLYYFPEIQVREEFPDPGRPAVKVTVTVSCGFRYHFFFQGMSRRMPLIADVWERHVFEKWAEEESRARLLNYLKNKGYLDARVESSLSTAGRDKTITFTARRNRRYRLGQVTVRGNQAVSDARVHEIIRADDLFFNRVFWLRLNSLVADLEVLKLYYYYQGISPIEIRLEPSFRGRRADVEVVIREGRSLRMGDIEFRGNRAFGRDELVRLMKSRTGSPYVPRQFSDDIARLQEYYWEHGYDDAAVSSELSPGDEKALLVTIDEGRLWRMGDLILIGASAAQRGLLRRLFPLQRGEPYRRSRVDGFRADVENSGVFSEVRVEKITAAGDACDVLVRVTPDHSRSYGLGIGWEERRGPRGTLEYQERNPLGSTSAVAATLQLGVATRNGRLIVNDRRGTLNIDTPLFLRERITSTFQLWEENETYPSYKFTRQGLGVSLAKRFSDNLYLLGSARWYRTELNWLAIPPFGVDQLDRPFNTTALSLSIVDEQRNDSFNPSRGHFLTADLKLGLPLFEKDYTFLKFYWNYQRHYPFLREGTFSVSLKNGIGFGDMSITERFFAGGGHSFRGTGNDRLGPINLDKNQPEGGNILLLLNLEATVPSVLLPVKDLYYTFFVDIGNVFAKSSDFNPKKLERALGFGLKYRSPLGPIRAEFGFNLRKAAEKNFHFIFTIGNVY